jgi:hypothetical protein
MHRLILKYYRIDLLPIALLVPEKYSWLEQEANLWRLQHIALTIHH